MTAAGPHVSPSMDSMDTTWTLSSCCCRGSAHTGALCWAKLSWGRQGGTPRHHFHLGGSVLRHLPRTHLTDSSLSRLSFENKPRWIFSSFCENLTLGNKEQQNQKYLMLGQSSDALPQHSLGKLFNFL